MTRYMVFGTSDDLIEMRLVVDYPEHLVGGWEFGIYNTSEEAPAELHFSDGTILAVWYGDGDRGVWRVVVKQEGSASVVIVPAEGEDDIYTDVAFVTGPDLKFDRCMCEGQVIEE